ncbi:MAG: hypothetical protein ACKN95_04775, partial [Holophagaceae bacterium]
SRVGAATAEIVEVLLANLLKFMSLGAPGHRLGSILDSSTKGPGTFTSFVPSILGISPDPVRDRQTDINVMKKIFCFIPRGSL